MSSKAIPVIALLRGINVGASTTVPMVELRALCAELGFGAVQSYIQSGNLVFRSRRTAARIETILEAAVAEQFRVSAPVLVRDAATWGDYVAQSPFPDATIVTPNLVMLAISKRPPPADIAELVRARALPGERVASGPGGLWIHYGGGAARSKIAPGSLDRLFGSPVTTRNWRTVVKLHHMAAENR